MTVQATNTDLNGLAKIGVGNDAKEWHWRVDGGSGDKLKLRQDNSDAWEINLNNELLLPNQDPPEANYGNRNSFVKAWGYYDTDGTALSSYNIGAITHILGSVDWIVDWDTNFSNANYVVHITGESASQTINAVIISKTDASVTFKLSGSVTNQIKLNISAYGTQ